MAIDLRFHITFKKRKKQDISFLQHTRITVKKATFGVDRFLRGTQNDEHFR
jgi:hypothetical protein